MKLRYRFGRQIIKRLEKETVRAGIIAVDCRRVLREKKRPSGGSQVRISISDVN